MKKIIEVIVLLLTIAGLLSCNKSDFIEETTPDETIITEISVKTAELTVETRGTDSPTLYLYGWYSEERESHYYPVFDYVQDPIKHSLTYKSSDIYTVSPAIKINSKRAFKGVITTYDSIEPINPITVDSSYSKSSDSYVFKFPHDSTKVFNQQYVGTFKIFYNEEGVLRDYSMYELESVFNAYSINSIVAVDTKGDTLNVVTDDLSIATVQPLCMYYWEGLGSVTNWYNYKDPYDIYCFSHGREECVDFKEAYERRNFRIEPTMNHIDMNTPLYLPNATGFSFKGKIDGESVEVNVPYDDNIVEALNVHYADRSDNGFTCDGEAFFKINLKLKIDKTDVSTREIKLESLTEKEVEVEYTVSL